VDRHQFLFSYRETVQKNYMIKASNRLNLKPIDMAHMKLFQIFSLLINVPTKYEKMYIILKPARIHLKFIGLSVIIITVGIQNNISL